METKVWKVDWGMLRYSHRFGESERVCAWQRERERGIDLFLTPRRAQCTARAAAEAGAMAAAGAAWTAVAKADPTPAPRWYLFKGVWTKAEADFPKPSLILSYAYNINNIKTFFGINATKHSCLAIKEENASVYKTLFKLILGHNCVSYLKGKGLTTTRKKRRNLFRWVPWLCYLSNLTQVIRPK